jgi:hypothetical protein
MKMTIGKKLFLCFGTALLLTLIVGGAALQGLSSVGALMDKAIKVNSKKLALAANIA